MDITATQVAAVSGALPPQFFLRFMYGILGSMAMFISAYYKDDRSKEALRQRHGDPSDVFDFIIVGGGTAGSILANRLSRKFKILLLERGGEPFPLQRIPALTQYITNHKEVDWMYKTEVQKKACLALKNKRETICQGKGLGGSSNLSYLMHLRGSPIDFAQWSRITNDSSWHYDQLLPYFKRQENYHGIWKNGYIHGFEGEVNIEVPGYTGLGSHFVSAAKELGYDHTDLNGLYSEGFDFVTSPIRRGYRDATYASFLYKIKGKRNLTIKKYSNVNKVLIAEQLLTAYGVEYESFGKTLEAFAKKEVILSAGAIQTPKILMLSGIGPKDHLAEIGIKVRLDLPVGESLKDQVMTHVGPFMISSGQAFLMDRDMTGASVAKFGMRDGEGPLTSSGIHGNGLICSQQAKLSKQSHWPDLQITLIGMSHHKTFDKDFAFSHHLNESLSSTFFKKSMGKDSFTIGVTLGRPKSTGTVRLRDTNPKSKPVIDPNYLNDPYDVLALMDGIGTALNIVGTKSFKTLGAKLMNSSFPGCEHQTYPSAKYWECYVRYFTMSSGNVASTCPMGLSSRNSVTDSKFNVHKMKRLRIVDTSIFPTIVSSPLQASVMMVAEKAADQIQKYWDITELVATGDEK